MLQLFQYSHDSVAIKGYWLPPVNLSYHSPVTLIAHSLPSQLEEEKKKLNYGFTVVESDILESICKLTTPAWSLVVE